MERDVNKSRNRYLEKSFMNVNLLRATLAKYDEKDDPYKIDWVYLNANLKFLKLINILNL